MPFCTGTGDRALDQIVSTSAPLTLSPRIASDLAYLCQRPGAGDLSTSKSLLAQRRKACRLGADKLFDVDKSPAILQTLEDNLTGWASTNAPVCFLRLCKEGTLFEGFEWGPSGQLHIVWLCQSCSWHRDRSVRFKMPSVGFN
eukprot:1840869-Rhodomonas_salina.1